MSHTRHTSARSLLTRPASALAGLVILALATTACSSTDEAAIVAGPGEDCITDYQPGTDYFPDKSTIRDAENVSIDYHESYQVVTVEQPFPGASRESYVLVKCGAPPPELIGDLASAPQITVPVQSLYSASTTHLPLLADLGRMDVLAGVANAANVSGAEAIERIDSGEVVEYAPGQTINVEKVITEAPDVLMTQGTDEPVYGKIRDAGVPVIANAEWLESTPLGRAEWLKVMAALTGSEKKADEVYTRIRSDYLEVVDSAAGAPARDVLPGQMYEGTWYMPAGGSYVGRLIADAGGTYPWADDDATGSLQLNFESMFNQAGTAPIWLVTSDWDTGADALADDPRYGTLSAMRGGGTWSANKAMGPRGGNDFYERGVTRPDLVLADLVAILHPELAPDHEFSFYREVPRP